MIDYNGAVALLDENRPGWFNEIDLDILDMFNCNRCILGQLYGDYWDGMGILGDQVLSIHEAFTGRSNKEIWIYMIKDKRDNSNPAPAAATQAVPVDRLAACRTMSDVQTLLNEYDTREVTVTLSVQDARAFAEYECFNTRVERVQEQVNRALNNL